MIQEVIPFRRSHTAKIPESLSLEGVRRKVPRHPVLRKQQDISDDQEYRRELK